MVLACHAPCSPLCPKDCSNLCPLNWLCYLTISSSTVPLLLLPSLFPNIRVFSSESALCIRWLKYWSFSISPSWMNIQGWFPLGLTVWSLCSSRDFKGSSPEPQFESINSLVPSLLYGPTLTSIYDCWKNHRFDNMDLYWQNDVPSFLIHSLDLS